jgi:hypothetical protein
MSIEAEPVAWVEHHKGGDNLVWDEPNKGTPLYTSREWAGLTDEEINVEAAKEEQAYGFIQGVTWAEAKLKELNT